MTTSLIFSGADVSGRDELLIRNIVSASGANDPTHRELSNPIAKSPGIFTIAIVVGFLSTPTQLARQAVDIGEVAIDLRDIDELAVEINVVRSERVQPNDLARRKASEMLALWRSANIEPVRVAGDPDGGIALYARGSGSGYARVLATNEGDLIVTCVDHSSGKQGLWALDESNAEASIARIRSFVIG